MTPWWPGATTGRPCAYHGRERVSRPLTWSGALAAMLISRTGVPSFPVL